ncbi:MAG: hypothetical protein M2R45_02622 [Verrucomicrobia subdivision 3 bacterium]|nr:hypothetical protein [Limisphaerales bacterium]MCS1416410.1 hypothetical protein [Limisphaerales bacterium]
MTSAEILGQLSGAAIAVLVGTLVVQFTTKKIANFKPPYGTTFLASLIGYLANYAIGFIVGFTITINKGEVSGMVMLLTLVIAFFVQAMFYSFMLKSPDGVTLGYRRACIACISSSLSLQQPS